MATERQRAERIDRLRRGLERAETVCADEVLRVVEEPNASASALARWRGDGDEAPRWEVTLNSAPDSMSDGDSTRLLNETDWSIESLACIAQSRCFGWSCVGEPVDSPPERWRAGRWPAQLPTVYERQLRMLWRRLDEASQQSRSSDRTERLRGSIERVVAELYGLDVGELVALECV